MKKGKILLLILLFVILFGSLSLTFTYYVMEENTKSVITFGNLKLQLEELTFKNGEYVKVNDNDSIDITNEKILSRIVKVKNVGKNPFYLRLKLNFSGQSKNNSVVDGNNLINIDINENWEKKGEYYYYKKALNPKEETTELMKEIKFDNKKILKNYQGSKFKLEIIAEAVQSENNATNVLEATGWPN